MIAVEQQLASAEPLQEPDHSGIEIAGRVGLDAVGQDAVQECPRQVRRGPPENGAPAPLQGGAIGRGEPGQLGLDRIV